MIHCALALFVFTQYKQIIISQNYHFQVIKHKYLILFFQRFLISSYFSMESLQLKKLKKGQYLFNYVIDSIKIMAL